MARLGVTATAPGFHAADAAGLALEGGAQGGVTLDIGERADGRSLTELREEEARVVLIAPGVYARVPTSEGRVRLLRVARGTATGGVVLHVAIEDDRSHLGRAVIDAPRRASRAIGLALAEPGDRFGPDGYVHRFFDEEELLGEIARSGLAVAARRGPRFWLVAADRTAARPAEKAETFLTEVARAARLRPVVDAGRARDTPHVTVGAMRALGRRSARVRGPIGRARLRRAIGWVDALGPGGANCYRRTLLELALDGGAARETVVFGLDVGSTGHVAFEGREDRTFDVSFAIHASTPDDLDVRGDPAEGRYKECDTS